MSWDSIDDRLSDGWWRLMGKPLRDREDEGPREGDEEGRTRDAEPPPPPPPRKAGPTVGEEIGDGAPTLGFRRLLAPPAAGTEIELFRALTGRWRSVSDSGGTYSPSLPCLVMELAVGRSNVEPTRRFDGRDGDTPFLTTRTGAESGDDTLLALLLPPPLLLLLLALPALLTPADILRMNADVGWAYDADAVRTLFLWRTCIPPG